MICAGLQLAFCVANVGWRLQKQEGESRHGNKEIGERSIYQNIRPGKSFSNYINNTMCVLQGYVCLCIKIAKCPG